MSLRLRILTFAFLLSGISLVPTFSFAQLATASNTYLGIHGGYILPSQIPGVTEIMSVAGARISFPQQVTWIELGLLDANAKGTTLYNANLSLKANIPLQSFYAFMLLGADFTYYTPPNTGTSLSAPGGHVGAGLGTTISDAVHFRSEMRFNFNPGVTMDILLGLEFQL